LISGATGAGTNDLKQAVMRYLEEHPRVLRTAPTADQLDEAAAAKAKSRSFDDRHTRSDGVFRGNRNPLSTATRCH